jgi:hypothetical protein
LSRSSPNKYRRNAKVAVAEAEEKLAEIAAQIEALGPVTDVSRLAMVIKATREIGDISGQIATSGREEQDARAAISRGLKSLRPAVVGGGIDGKPRYYVIDVRALDRLASKRSFASRKVAQKSDAQPTLI